MGGFEVRWDTASLVASGSFKYFIWPIPGRKLVDVYSKRSQQPGKDGGNMYVFYVYVHDFRSIRPEMSVARLAAGTVRSCQSNSYTPRVTLRASKTPRNHSGPKGLVAGAWISLHNRTAGNSPTPCKVQKKMGLHDGFLWFFGCFLHCVPRRAESWCNKLFVNVHDTIKYGTQY